MSMSEVAYGANESVRVLDWTEERVAELKRLWMEGRSASQVARQLGGVSRNAVIGKVHRIGLAGRDRPTQPRALGGSAPSRAKAGAASSSPRRRSVRLTPSSTPWTPRPELTATATLLTLAPQGCRWPIGDPQHDDFGFCGRDRGDQVSYCRHHAQMSLRRSSRAVTAEPAAPRVFTARW